MRMGSVRVLVARRRWVGVRRVPELKSDVVAVSGVCDSVSVSESDAERIEEV